MRFYEFEAKKLLAKQGAAAGWRDGEDAGRGPPASERSRRAGGVEVAGAVGGADQGGRREVRRHAGGGGGCGGGCFTVEEAEENLEGRRRVHSGGETKLTVGSGLQGR